MKLIFTIMLTTYFVFVSCVPGLGPDSPYRHLLDNGLELSTTHWQKLPPHLQKLFVKGHYKNMFGGMKGSLLQYRADYISDITYKQILQFIR